MKALRYVGVLTTHHTKPLVFKAGLERGLSPPLAQHTHIAVFFLWPSKAPSENAAAIPAPPVLPRAASKSGTGFFLVLCHPVFILSLVLQKKVSGGIKNKELWT